MSCFLPVLAVRAGVLLVWGRWFFLPGPRLFLSVFFVPSPGLWFFPSFSFFVGRRPQKPIRSIRWPWASRSSSRRERRQVKSEGTDPRTGVFRCVFDYVPLVHTNGAIVPASYLRKRRLPRGGSGGIEHSYIRVQSSLSLLKFSVASISLNLRLRNKALDWARLVNGVAPDVLGARMSSSDCFIERPCTRMISISSPMRK